MDNIRSKCWSKGLAVRNHGKDGQLRNWVTTAPLGKSFHFSASVSPNKQDFFDFLTVPGLQRFQGWNAPDELCADGMKDWSILNPTGELPGVWCLSKFTHFILVPKCWAWNCSKTITSRQDCVNCFIPTEISTSEEAFLKCSLSTIHLYITHMFLGSQEHSFRHRTLLLQIPILMFSKVSVLHM